MPKITYTRCRCYLAWWCFAMKLTDKELEIMAVLWGSGSPMTATEIIEASNNRTWKENSIYILMNTLIKKGAVLQGKHKPTITKNARAYEPALTSEEYTVMCIKNVQSTGVRVDIHRLIEHLMEAEEG